MDNNQISSTSTDWPLNAMPQRWIQKLFNEMLMAYGKKFTDQWQGADATELQKHWALKLAGLSGEELKRGVGKLDAREWPPTLPEFIKLCRPEVDPFVIYCEAVAGVAARNRGEVGKWSHPAVYWASVGMAFDLGSQTYAQIRVRWETALAEQMSRGEWPEIPQPVLALNAPGKSVLSKEKAAEMIQELGAVGIGKTYEQEMDHKSWAKHIMKREQIGDRTLTHVQVRFAKEALNIN